MNNIKESNEKLPRKVVSKIVIGLTFGLAFIAAYLLWGDFHDVLDVLRSIPFAYFFAAIACTLLSYLLRFTKWHYLLKSLKIDINKMESLNIFFIGLSMSITPGKVGELIKPYIIRNVKGIEMSKSVPAVFIDRITDILAMMVIVSLGAYVFSFKYYIILFIVFTLLILVCVLQSKHISSHLIKLAALIRPLRKYKAGIEGFLNATSYLLRPQVILITSLISIIAWLLECVSLFILVSSLGYELNIYKCAFVFSLGTIAGAISMLPGGLGVAEGSITGLLIYFNLKKTMAVSISLLVRLVTLWLGVVIGLFIFFVKRKRYINASTENPLV